MSSGVDFDALPWLDLRRAVECTPPPLDFVLPGLKSGTVGALVSPGGTGKTMLALQAAVTIAGGPDTLGLANMGATWERGAGRVVFLTGEDPDSVLSARVHAIGRILTQREREAVFENLSIATLMGCGADLTG